MSAVQVRERPTWFGPTERPLFGWVTRPDGDEAVGGLVLAPTLGREARAGRRALRELARAAAQRGFVVLRFDYDGTGDSAGRFDDPDRDVAWTRSVGAACELLHAAGLESIGVVGLRLGATIAGCAAGSEDLGLDALVLWDPCDSGRNWLRELAALEALRRERTSAERDGSVVTAEHVFGPDAAAALRRLDLTATDGPLAKRVLVVRREERPASAKLLHRLDGPQVEWRTTAEQGALLDVDPLFAAMPTSTVDSIVTWLTEGASAPKAVKPFGGTERVALREDGTDVAERTATLGERGLFGIVTEPASSPVGDPVVVLLNVANEDHSGPSRLWVDLARRWAAHGLRCVRFDLTGIGDSPGHPSGRPRAIYEQEWLEDTTQVAAALAASPSDAVFVGLCSGAFWAVEAGMATHARGVCVVNPPIGIDFLHGVNRLGDSRRAPLRRLAERLKDLALHLRWVSVVLWKVLRLVAPSVFGVDVLRRTAEGSDLLVLATREDLSPFGDGHRLDRFFSRRLVAPQGYEVHFVEGLDHSLHDPEGRRRAVELLDRHVLERFAPTPTTTNHTPKEQP